MKYIPNYIVLVAFSISLGLILFFYFGNPFALVNEEPIKMPLPAEKMVFAHYMVCCPTAGGGAGIEDYKNEILQAQKHGIDGFALNCGGWQKFEPHYKERTLLIYEAARQLGTDFQLFVSADGEALTEVDDILISVSSLSNQFCYRGKPVLSTFGGEGLDDIFGNNLIKLVHSKGAVLVPFFYPRPDITEHPTERHARQLLSSFPDLDGYFYFGAAGTGEQITKSSAPLAREFRKAGKVYMAGITPYYRGNESNFRLFETHGFESMALEWESAIKDGATWVELVTWNDWSESTYLAPFGKPSETGLWNGHFGSKMLSHVAYLEASRYYIDWFKTGVKPPIIQDKMFYFYRLHPKELRIPISTVDRGRGEGLPNGALSLQDNVFVTLFLTKPAELFIESGHKKKHFKIEAGISHISMPFAVGNQQFSLYRDGELILNKIGEHQISDFDTRSRFNYFSGSAAVLDTL